MERKVKEIPHIYYSVFQDSRGVPHVVPMIDGKPMKGHKFFQCNCYTTVDKGGNLPVITHSIIH